MGLRSGARGARGARYAVPVRGRRPRMCAHGRRRAPIPLASRGVASPVRATADRPAPATMVPYGRVVSHDWVQ